MRRFSQTPGRIESDVITEQLFDDRPDLAARDLEPLYTMDGLRGKLDETLSYACSSHVSRPSVPTSLTSPGDHFNGRGARRVHCRTRCRRRFRFQISLWACTWRLCLQRRS